MNRTEKYINHVIQEAILNIENNGGPFGAIIVLNNKIISTGVNSVTLDNDPTAHAEINAIRKAAKTLGKFDLTGCILYSSCEPCPMCLSAIYWAHIDKVYYASNRDDAHNAGFDDQFIYYELDKPIKDRKIPFENIYRDKAAIIFEKWKNKIDKTLY